MPMNFLSRKLICSLLLVSAAVPMTARADATPFLSSEVPTLAPMLKQVLPAVVNIRTSGTVEAQGQNPLLNDPFFRRFFGVPNQPQERETQSIGSGVIVDSAKGYILTNAHVVAGADSIKIILNDLREIDAKLIGADAETDVAVLKVEDQGLSSLRIANSDNLEIGDFVVAIGNPFGLGQTVTSGIVSALGRTTQLGGYQDFIQTDASINPGNSGGALVNLRGELVGINSQIVSRSGGNIGIGFSIPINLARVAMDQLIEYGDVQRGKLGIIGQPLTPELAKAFGLKDSQGALIAQVLPDTPAEKAGLKAEDIILEINGKEVRNFNQLRNEVGLMRVGEKVKLVVLRDGRRKRITAEIGSDVAATSAGAQVHPRLQGAGFGPIAPEHPLAGKIEGVMVQDIEPRSPAARAGLRPGDVITSVNRKPVSNVQQFSELADGSGQLLLHIRRGNGALFILVQ